GYTAASFSTTRLEGMGAWGERGLHKLVDIRIVPHARNIVAESRIATEITTPTYLQIIRTFYRDPLFCRADVDVRNGEHLRTRMQRSRTHITQDKFSESNDSECISHEMYPHQTRPTVQRVAG